MIPLFSTAYFPPISCIAQMARYDVVRIEAKETFPKQTYRNRMEIMTSAGVRALVVPTVRRNNSRTEEVGVSYAERWNTIHLRTLTAAYAASPYYEFYKDDLEAILEARYDRLIDLNRRALGWVLQKLKVECNVSFTDDYLPSTTPPDPEDFRMVFSPKKKRPSNQSFEPYYQVFSDRICFTPDLSIVDLLMNLGPEAADYIRRCL